MSIVEKGNPVQQVSDRPPVERLLRPIQEFTKLEASGGILLLLCTVTALVWANSPWAASYQSLWQTTLTLGMGDIVIDKPLILWINDGLMAIFFFVVGLEIKREVLIGELATFRQAALPISAAIGGMLVPAALYFMVTAGTEGAGGWGIPMATDIAFALGVLALLGKRVPLALKIFVTALAIVDDIGAVLVIAFFYTAEIAWTSLAIGGVFLLGMIGANRLGVRHPMLYSILGFGLWVAFLKSGVHATIAGVLAAMTIPATSRINIREFIDRGSDLIQRFRSTVSGTEQGTLSSEQQATVQTLEKACHKVETPLQRLEHDLHYWVAFFIIPIFALANAGVSLEGNAAAALTHPVGLGIILGLIVGKQLGITLLSWLAVRSGIADLPPSVSWRQIYGASCLAGIGFTMSLFIGALSFSDDSLLTIAKIGILGASLLSGIMGWVVLSRSTAKA